MASRGGEGTDGGWVVVVVVGLLTRQACVIGGLSVLVTCTSRPMKLIKENGNGGTVIPARCQESPRTGHTLRCLPALKQQARGTRLIQ